MNLQDTLMIAGVVIGLSGIGFGIYQYYRQKKDERDRIRLQHKEEKIIKEEEEIEQIKKD